MCKKDLELIRRGLPPMHAPYIAPDGEIIKPTFSYEFDPDNQPVEIGGPMPPVRILP